MKSEMVVGYRGATTLIENNGSYEEDAVEHQPKSILQINSDDDDDEEA